MLYPLLLSAMMEESRRIELSITPEQREAREERRKRAAQRSLIQSKELKIRSNICPSCECKGQLKRGKRIKKLNYARHYKCGECKEDLYIGG